MKFSFFYTQAGIFPDQVLYRNAIVKGVDDPERYELYFCGSLGTIAEIPEDCARFLKFIEDVENGTEDEIETGANDVVLTFRRSGVQVDILINDEWCGQPEGHFELMEWKIALEGWQRFLHLPRSLQSVIETTL